MSFIDKIWVRLFTKKIGEDEFGNEYRVSNAKNYLGQNKRFVTYNGLNISSKVPPMWHAWLHYMSDKVPDNNKMIRKAWQKDFKPNLTGTKNAHDYQSPNNKIPKYVSWNKK